MELFTLGIGNYTEADIRESARAFTGWAHDGQEFIFRKFDHDTGEKTFFGRRGDFDGYDIIDIILQQPACPRYIASRLWNFFVQESPEQPLMENLGAQLRDGKWDLRPVIRTMLTSQAFYSPKTVGAQIKSPIQLVVGTVRLLGVDMPQRNIVQGALTQMGQVPLQPPNVKGWPGGRMWINTSTLFVRYNTAVFLAGGGGKVPVATKMRPGKFDMKLTDARKLTGGGDAQFAPDARAASSPQAIVDAWLDRLIQRPVEADKKKVLLDALGDRPHDERNVKQMVQLIVSMPEYQLC
jgi:uncharacterized protein (DUF1800 family)